MSFVDCREYSWTIRFEIIRELLELESSWFPKPPICDSMTGMSMYIHICVCMYVCCCFGVKPAPIGVLGYWNGHSNANQTYWCILAGPDRLIRYRLFFNFLKYDTNGFEPDNIKGCSSNNFEVTWQYWSIQCESEKKKKKNSMVFSP